MQHPFLGSIKVSLADFSVMICVNVSTNYIGITSVECKSSAVFCWVYCLLGLLDCSLNNLLPAVITFQKLLISTCLSNIPFLIFPTFWCQHNDLIMGLWISLVSEMLWYLLSIAFYSTFPSDLGFELERDLSWVFCASAFPRGCLLDVCMASTFGTQKKY